MKRNNQDKKAIFLHWWRLLAPDLPAPVGEYHFTAEACGGTGEGIRARLKQAGLRDFRYDLAWPEYRIAVEVDGGQYAPNGGYHMTDDHREKINTGNDLRWFVYHYSPQQLKRDPAGCVEQVARAIKLELE